MVVDVVGGVEDDVVMNVIPVDMRTDYIRILPL